MRRSCSDQRQQGLALLAATDQALGPDPSVDAVGVGPGRYRLLASAIAGRTVEVVSGTPHEAAWTDGSSIFVDPEAQAGHLLATVVVQAALLGAGSLDRQMIAALFRRPTLSRRYLAVEGHRALEVHEELLPPPLRRGMNPALARRTDSPAMSMALANSREHIDDAPAVFGTIRPRRMRAPSQGPQQQDTFGRHVPRKDTEPELRYLDEAKDEVDTVIDMLASPVGGGGGLGRLLKDCWGRPVPRSAVHRVLTPLPTGVGAPPGGPPR